MTGDCPFRSRIKRNAAATESTTGPLPSGGRTRKIPSGESANRHRCPCRVGPGISQAMAPDVMKGPTRRRARGVSLSARAFGQGRLQTGDGPEWSRAASALRSFPVGDVQSPRQGRSTITSSWNRPISLGYRASVSTVASPRSTARRPRPLDSMGAEGRSRIYGHLYPNRAAPLGARHSTSRQRDTADSRGAQHRCGTEVAGSNAGQIALA